ncbi:hypothetical protein BpHYR1_036200 [Brachionus plicatilis]|uniref:Uncharacterized protein n=1 Tax=Brachionus plicatilis TaxID=10195 RepID=A0A3M7RKI9_BRAPC|nr:hypothetical protein BpHYR1_036200 [Brachionus plicatilis]
MNEVNSSKNSFLPPLKFSKRSISLSQKNPVLIENNLKKDKEILEIGIDKFSVLTNQPGTIEKIRIDTFLPKSNSIDNLNNNFTSSTNYEWNTREMPKLKINRSSDLSVNFNENSSEKKKKLLFEQKLLIEQKQLEQNFRNIRANELLVRSNETYKRISKDKVKARNFDQHFKKDIWSSNDFRDINLQNDIIKTFYSMDSRPIRHFRKFRNEFYTFKPNTSKV